MVNPYARTALRHLHNGVDGGDLCVPCQKAFDDDKLAGLARIGTPTWLNDGFREYGDGETLPEPIFYCDCCRHILRNREFQRRQGRPQDAPPILENFTGEFDGFISSVFLHDDHLNLKEYDASLDGFRPEKSEYSRTVRHHWADVDMIKSWLYDCENNHGSKCSEHRQSVPETESLLLLDVVDDCLVVGNFSYRYFALSYVWGDSKQFLTLVENYDQLRKPGSVSTQQLTQTIRDSMSFVKSLGERYLWIDTMCIIQNDAANKANALAQMCSIYSCAVATIVALSGDSADAGLPGIPPTARNTTATFIEPGLHLVERSFLERMLTNHNYDHVDVECVYNIRAWTFQERLLSNRSIYFLSEQVYFHCKKQLTCEDRYVSDDTLFYTLEKMRVTSAERKAKAIRYGTYSPLDEFCWYEDIIKEYTAKMMRYPDDILNAFTGIQTELGRMFDWSFVAGLPVPLLDVALLWTPMTTVKRRVIASPQPSWSWSGWIGRVGYADLVRPGHRPMSSLFRPLATHNLNSSMPGKLVLECMSVTCNAFEFVKVPKQLMDPFGSRQTTEDSYFIFDRAKRRCGVLIGLDEYDALCSSAEDFRLLSLSAWKSNNSLTTNGPVIAYLLEDGTRSDEELYDKTLRDTEWCTCNVMLVRSVGTAAYERVAVGQIHTDVLSEAGEAQGTFIVQ